MQWAKAMGARYIAFRFLYEVQLRTGILKSKFPTQPQSKIWISLSDWKTNTPAFFFASCEALNSTVQHASQLKQHANRIKNGEIQFFNGEWKRIENHQWLLNSSTGYQYPNTKHWTEIPDFDATLGDIKYVWEKNRFTFLQTILRYDLASGEDSSEWVFMQMESWIESNPINQGPNYRCSQEISLRLFNWILALYFYKNSNNLTEARFQKIIFAVYWQIKHVRTNIHFSRIAVRNNHAIAETMGLYTAGLLFPFFDEAAEWKAVGKNWFEQEILFQVYEDGSYLQYSFNYQRVVVQLMTWAFSLAHHHGDVFSKPVYERAYRSVKLLATCQEANSGMLPNYGANDGSLFFNWNDEHFRDFRPSLDALHFLLTSQQLYADSYEDRSWFGLETSNQKLFKKLQIADGVASFDTGGIYIYRTANLLIFIACVTYKNRPSQADNLHLDVWQNGVNVLRDAGSYKYNTDPKTVKYFFGTQSHNTVMLDNDDQMLKGTRFIWFNWSSALTASWTEHEDEYIFQGEINAFRNQGKIIHTRKVSIKKKSLSMEVVDVLKGSNHKLMRQLWHINPSSNLNIIAVDENENVVEAIASNGLYSPTYGVKEDALQYEFSTNSNKITSRLFLA